MSRGSQSPHSNQTRRNTFLRIVLSLLLWCLVYCSTIALNTTQSRQPLTTIPDLSYLPSHCQSLATLFWQLQSTSPKDPLVLACHRQWCGTWGHCDPCAGIGDRTRSLFSLVEHAMELQQPILLDYPNGNLVIPSALVYREGLWSNLLHTRAYDVSSRTTDSNKWGNHGIQFAHFFAGHQWNKEEYNPCWFPILFQPSKRLLSEIEKYNLNPMHSIGIHFRTGDGVAFGVTNKDIRVVGDLELALDKMVKCAMLTHQQHANGTNSTPPMIFLATDNVMMKDLAQQKYSTTVFTTTIPPTSYLKSDLEFGVWLDFFLLLKCHTIIVNQLRRGYTGTAFSISTMASMVKEVRQLSPEQFVQCDLEA